MSTSGWTFHKCTVSWHDLTAILPAMNISKENYDALISEIEILNSQVQTETQRAIDRRDHIEGLTESLHKAHRALHGQPLIDRRQAGMAGHAGHYVDGLTLDLPTPLSRTERAEKREADLNERVVALETRIAAAVTVIECTGILMP